MKYLTTKYPLLKLLCTLLLLACMNTQRGFAQSENNNIKGVVKDIKGNAIEGVAITSSNDFSTVFTDVYGKFSLAEEEEGITLSFEQINYKPFKFVVKDRTATINIILETLVDNDNFKVGYVERDKYSMTTAVSTVRAKEISRSPAVYAENALVGKASGLTIMRNSGNEPGYESSNIYIRGIGTYGKFTSPLILIDDIERDFKQLDIDEIESVSILKDGASNTQYGQRGANGTILISTKRGFVGKPQIEFSTQFGTQRPTRLPKFLGSKEYLKLYNKALLNDGMPIPTDNKLNPEMYNGDQDPYLYPAVDWYSSLLKKSAPQQQHKISFRGGSDIIKYFIFFGYLDQGGIYDKTNLNSEYDTNIKYNRYNIRSNFDANISKTLSVSLDLGARMEDRNMPNYSSADIFKELSTITPNAMPIQYEGGKIAGTATYTKNPLGMIAHSGYRKDRNKVVQIKAQGTQKLDYFLPGLALNATVAYDGVSGYGTRKEASYATYELQPDGSYITKGEDKPISINLSKAFDFYQYMLDFHSGLSYAMDFGVNSILADVRYYQSQLYIQGDNPAFARQGINGKATYSYNKKYIAEVSFAYDGSEEFARGKRFGFFPSISGGWILSNESFLKNNSSISFLKLRASYGEAGNSKTGLDRYAYQSHWYGFDASYGGYIFGSGFSWSDGAWEGRLSNPNLRWETTRNINVGIDAELFTNFTLNFDVFRHDRKNIISENKNTSSLIVGAPFAYMNIGSVLNRGFELAMTYKKSVEKLNYFVQGNLSFARNEITAMDEVDGLPEYQRRTGKSVTQLWGLQANGFYADAQDISNSPISTFYGVKPGDIKYINQNPNEDNHINIYDEIPLGKPTVPEWTFGLCLGLDYKGFDISSLFSGVANRSVYLNNVSIWGIQNNNKATGILYGAWEKGVREADATYPRLTTENNLNNYRSSSFWIKNGNFIRLSNIELGYQIPQSILQKIKIKFARFYINGQNLLSIDNLGKYDLDPEVFDAGVTGYPNMKIYNVGLNIKF